MIYNNLLIFLTAVVLFSIDTVPEEPMVSGLSSLSIFLFLLFLFHRIARSTYKKTSTIHPGGYFKAEKKLSLIALLFFGATLYLCDVKYYLAFLSFGDRFPSLVDICGLALLLLFFAVIWQASYQSYRIVFGSEQEKLSFILLNIRTNLPIVLPWIGISLLSDLSSFLPWPWFQNLSNNPWGELIFFIAFIFMVLLFFPPMIRALWGCKKLDDGSLKKSLMTFCKRLGFNADIYSWPLLGGRVPTAAVMGMIPGLRYILITPALAETMSITEMEAIMAHEIGHVKRFHMLLYVLLIGGFSFFAVSVGKPIAYYVLSFDFLYSFIDKTNINIETLFTFLGSVPLLLVMLLYFRFVFGYFIRNFERQADIYSFTALGSSSALVSAFERLALITGNSKDQPSWHHFSLGQRINYLKRCESDPSWVGRHHKKVYSSLLAYILVLALGAFWSSQLSTQVLIDKSNQKYIETAIMQQVKKGGKNTHLLAQAGDVMARKKLEKQALVLYQRALDVDPANWIALNNFAWLLLTSDDLQLRDPARALTTARMAVTIQPQGFILDTLATAFWANNYLEEAVMTEKKAIAADPAQRQYYQNRIYIFQHQSYQDSLKKERSDTPNGE